ncbi:LysR family transcriptional regulator [Aeromonas veronii]|uniref:LysR family transcriptional regulator n=1 Tax=Aeromonas veronii TaxID=654 RepID=UPI003EC87BAE
MFRPKSTFEQWRIFQAVVDCGGYAQAAEALNKSQSSLNHAVAKLQQSLGVPLLEVRGRKAVLTPAGEIFLKRARQLSQQVEELENLANNLERQWEPQINLYVSALQPRDRLYRALASFYPRSRGCRVNLHERIHCHFNALQPGDLMLSEHLPGDRTGLLLDEVCLLPLCAANHPLAQEEGPSAATC